MPTIRPLHVLERIFAQAGVDVPGIVPCDWGTGDSVATNFNGGFLYVPRGFVSADAIGMARMGRVPAWASGPVRKPRTSRPHGSRSRSRWRSRQRRLPYRHLSASWNLPLHSPGVPRGASSSEAVVSGLHYHWCLDAFGLDRSRIQGPRRRRRHRSGESMRRLAPGTHSLFFDLYKRHLAREAVRARPEAPRSHCSPTPSSNGPGTETGNAG